MKINNIEFTEADFNNPKLYKRFLKHVVIQGVDGCWEWTGSRFDNGYGQFKFKRKPTKAHRIAYLLANGPDSIPEGMLTLHVCDRPECVNPRHLFLGTASENQIDCVKKGRSSCLANLPTHTRGIKNGNSKLTEEDALLIHRLKTSNLTRTQIAEIFNVSYSQISKIQTGRSWKHLL